MTDQVNERMSNIRMVFSRAHDAPAERENDNLKESSLTDAVIHNMAHSGKCIILITPIV